MRLSHLVAGGLIVLLLIGALVVYFNPLASDTTLNPSENRVSNFVNEESRFQGIHFHEQEGELDLVYLYSYEPISKRFAAIYVPPDINIVSSSFANVRTIKQLYDSMSPAALSDELSIVLDVPIPFWSVTRDNHLSRIVNLTGGTRLPSPESAVNIQISGGQQLDGQWMDGSMTLDYVSNSYQDFGIQGLRYRHKTFFLGYLNWINQQEHLLDHRDTFRRIHGMLDTNLTRPELKRLTTVFLNLEAETIKFPAVSGQISTENERHLSSERLKNMLPRPLKEIIQEAEPQETIRVQVLNGAGIGGLAGDLRDFLQQQPRIDVVEVGNADRYDYEITRVINRNNNPESAYHVLEVLNAGEYESDPSEELMVDVTVVAGQDLENIKFRQ